MGFEDELSKRFKGVAFSLLEQVDNPLLEGLPSARQLENVQIANNKKKEIEMQEDIVEVIPEREDSK